MNWYREFERCLDKRWLVRMPEARYLVTKELDVAHDDLAEAEAGYERGSYKWSTIQSYYAMFHAARALLYSRGYQEKSHHCLSVAMRHLFVSKRALDGTLIDDMDDARAGGNANYVPSYICFWAVWFGGLILTIVITRRVWRRKQGAATNFAELERATLPQARNLKGT